MIKKMNEKERKEPPKERVVEKGGPTIPLGRQIELEVKLEDGTIFRHPKKEGIDPSCKFGRKGSKTNSTCVRVRKQMRDENTGRKVEVAAKMFPYNNTDQKRAALESAVRFRDGLWAEVAAGKSVEQLKQWAGDWNEKDEESDSEEEDSP